MCFILLNTDLVNLGHAFVHFFFFFNFFGKDIISGQAIVTVAMQFFNTRILKQDPCAA